MKFSDLKELSSVADSNELRKHLTKMEAAITGKTFCTSCQTPKPTATGTYKKIRQGKRFVCADCVARWASRGGGR